MLLCATIQTYPYKPFKAIFCNFFPVVRNEGVNGQELDILLHLRDSAKDSIDRVNKGVEAKHAIQLDGLSKAERSEPSSLAKFPKPKPRPSTSGNGNDGEDQEDAKRKELYIIAVAYFLQAEHAEKQDRDTLSSDDRLQSLLLRFYAWNRATDLFVYCKLLMDKNALFV